MKEFEVVIREDPVGGLIVDLNESCVLGRVDLLKGPAADAAETALGHWMLEGKAIPVAGNNLLNSFRVRIDSIDPKSGILVAAAVAGSQSAVLRLTWPTSETDRCGEFVDLVVAEFSEKPSEFLALERREDAWDSGV